MRVKLRNIAGLAFVWAAALLHAEPYELGHGIRLDNGMNIGGYFSSEFESGKTSDTLTLDDLAIMAYGDINPSFSYLAELESVGFYHKNLTNGTDGGDQKFHVERLYGDWQINESFNLRFGKQITPIGYWNLEPINVLRDTSSNPLYAMLLFPRFLTGIDINGYLPGSDETTYHLFGQSTHDLDDEYINIPNTHFYGFSVDKEFSMQTSGGGSIGEYITLANSERTRFVQGQFRFDNGEWKLTTEAMVAKTEYASGPAGTTTAGYAQLLYRLNPQHAVVGRYEYFDRRRDDYTDNIGIVGYSYRPVYPVSLKGEYQWHSISDENRFLCSFSVLF